MLEPADLEKIDQLQNSIQRLLDDAVEQYGALSSSQQDVVRKIIRGLDSSWEKLLSEVGESNSEVPETSIRALLACGCVMACLIVIQADEQISVPEREVLLHLTSGLSDPLSLGGMTPVSSGTSTGTIEFYTHLVDTYDVMDHQIAGTLCAAIDHFRGTKLMARFARLVTLLGKEISFVDGETVDQRELSVLHDFEESMKRLTKVINSAGL